MNKTLLKSLVLLLLVSFTFKSCQKSDNLPVNLEAQDFVWKGLNLWYFWQEQVPDLADSRFSTQGQLNSYIAGFESPADLFQSLRFQPGVEDRFSIILDDYIELENSLQGINLTNGMEFGLVRYDNDPTNVFGYVRYVIPGSDAETQGVTRGMIFSQVDGTQLTDTNFNGLLFGSNTNYTISLADFNGGNPTINGLTISLTKTQLQENPIHLVTTITDGANKVGYIMYNQFLENYDAELNSAFAFFQSENITDLIVDLRYNGGGDTDSAKWLATMITGQFNGELFARQSWNSKVTEALPAEIFIDNFTNEILNTNSSGQVTLQQSINSLNLDRVYFITTGSTASASELVMNGLAPYITVNSVGTTTVGKVHGSIPLYDSDDFSRNGPNLNENHTWAMLPLTFETVNNDGTNQPGGINPTVNLPEDYGNLGALGTRSDPLIDRTMILITTGSRTSVGSAVQMNEISNSQINRPLGNNMLGTVKVAN
jgi:C-terminal processing protease CtpA/Prc